MHLVISFKESPIATQAQRVPRTPEARSKYDARAGQILDSAAILLRRWGYNKTTVDDIARHAGVAKGTIYLHWKTREDLFIALFAREERRLAEDIKQRIAGDPDSPA
ncbi:MAG: TetR/AcrR family transcriptional regulator, partial [Chloroflexota bacterium]|nr:TetR/AcrR family transcriptional regulator [Chloroflexota bacterium]